MREKGSALEFSITGSIMDIPRAEWDRLFDQGLIEGYGYHKTVEDAQLKEFSLYYLLAKRNGRLSAIIPFFVNDFSFTTLIQGPAQKFIQSVQTRFPRFLRTKIMFLGFPTAEELYLGINNQEDTPALLKETLRYLYCFAKAQKVTTILFYNLTEKQRHLNRCLKRLGFVEMENFPNTVLTLGASSFDEYTERLSKNMRKDLLRKLKKSQGLELHTETLDNADAVIDEIYPLYLNNFGGSEVHFELLTPEFFKMISVNMPGKVKFFITRLGHKIVAFNLCLVQKDTCIDKFIGFDARAAKEYHLYFTTFRHNIDWCIKHGVRSYQMGITDYHPKIRLGATLVPLYVYARFVNPVLNFIGKPLARFIQPKNFDPVLKNLKNR